VLFSGLQKMALAHFLKDQSCFPRTVKKPEDVAELYFQVTRLCRRGLASSPLAIPQAGRKGTFNSF
jgi:hypothetical protein